MKAFPLRLLLLLGITLVSCFPADEEVTISDDFQEEFISIVNQYRAQGCRCGSKYMPPVDPLAWNDKLGIAAQKHANDMQQNRHFSHTGTNGSSISDRIEAAGYDWRAIAENISYGYADIKSAVEGWISSPGHCKNIMNGAYKEMGAARAGTYWVQTFGSAY